MANDVLPSYAGLITFMRSEVKSPPQLRPGEIGVVGVPFDTTLGTRPGARYGPRGIREASIHFIYHLEAVDRTLINLHTGKKISFPPKPLLFDTGDVQVYPSDVPHSTQGIADGIYAIASRGAMPLILGGDHYVSYPCVNGYLRAANEAGAKRVGYLQIDAHLDLSDHNDVWGGYYHGSMARRISEENLIRHKNMVWWGIGSTVALEQYEWARRSGVSLITREEIRTEGVEKTLQRAVETAFDGVDSVYLSIDIDVIDFSNAQGTGSYNFNGISSSEYMQAISILSAHRYGAVDLCEVAPNLDASGATSRLAANSLIALITPALFEEWA